MQQSSTLGTSPDPCDLEAPWPIRARKDPWWKGGTTALAHGGTLVDTWWVPVGPRCVGVDETPVVESEGKRSSMGQMVPAGWAVHTVPAGLVQTAPSMLGP